MHRTLHRDIFWLGKQWAVTGFGIQAVDSKLEMQFDIDTNRIWEDGLATSMVSEPWFDAQDFEEALMVARRRSGEPPVIYYSVGASEK